jgi:hypothetical protein
VAIPDGKAPMSRPPSLNGASRQVKPLPSAVFQRGQPNPLKDTVFIAPDLENRVCGCAVQKMKPAAQSLALEEETADPMAGQTRHVLFQALYRKADDLQQPLRATGQATIEPQNPLPVPAKGVQTDIERPSVRPKEAIALEVDSIRLAIAGRVSLKQNG